MDAGLDVEFLSVSFSLRAGVKVWKSAERLHACAFCTNSAPFRHPPFLLRQQNSIRPLAHTHTAGFDDAHLYYQQDELHHEHGLELEGGIADYDLGESAAMYEDGDAGADTAHVQQETGVYSGDGYGEEPRQHAGVWFALLSINMLNEDARTQVHARVPTSAIFPLEPPCFPSPLFREHLSVGAGTERQVVVATVYDADAAH